MLNRKVILSTERLWLHELSVEEAQDIFILNLDPEVLRYTGDSPFESVEAAREFLRQYDAYQKTGMGRWAIRTIGDDKFIGWCGLKLHDNGEVDLGYRLLRTHWNRGYATEAAKACLQFGFESLGLKYIIGRVMHDNTASIRVLEKLGMNYWKDIICDEHPAKCYVIRAPEI